MVERIGLDVGPIREVRFSSGMGGNGIFGDTVEFAIRDFFSTEAYEEKVLREEVIDAEVMDSGDEFPGCEVPGCAEDDYSSGRYASIAWRGRVNAHRLVPKKCL